MDIRCFPILFPATIAFLHAEPYKLQPNPAKIQSPAITEASGLAVSPTDPAFLWIVNDSGGSAELHLVATDGCHRGSVTIEGATNRDWEDLAAFSYGGKNYLLIADTGDNSSKRKFCTLYIVAEPSLPANGKSISGKNPIAWKIDFTYEDGPRDCEAVGVDVAAEKIILINKRTEIPSVYELHLHPKKNPIARKIGATETRAEGLAASVAFGNQPTGMDISADGMMAAVVTYYGVFVFKRDKEGSWAEAFSRKPEALGTHGLQQAESVAFARDGKYIFAVSEKANSPIASYLATP